MWFDIFIGFVLGCVVGPLAMMLYKRVNTPEKPNQTGGGIDTHTPPPGGGK